MNILDELMQKDPSLVLHNEGDWQNPFDPGKPGYSSFNDAGICTEDGEFLYSMVRILKPAHVLETGTHWAIGASYMGKALEKNNTGDLDTIEFLQEIHQRALQRIRDLGLQTIVTCHFGDAANFNPGDKQYKLILLDTEPQTRFNELIKFFPNLEPGGFVFIHDLHQHMHQIPNEEHGFAWPFGPIPETIKQWVREGKLRPMHFETPRGLTGFYKPHPNDYQWS